jgi:hypothetical protein
MVLALLPELELLLFVAGAVFFWSLPFACAEAFGLELPAEWLPVDFSVRLSEEVDLFWEVEGFVFEVVRLSLLISD